MPSIINATTTNGVAVSGDNSGALALQTNNGTTAVTIDTSQRVGIGTTTPSTLLYVRQAAATSVTTTGTNQCIIENNGAVGISLLTPTANQATIRHSTALDQISSSIVFDGTNRYMAFTTVNGTERMRIDNLGNVGIGGTPYAWATIAPGLDVGPTAGIASFTNQAVFAYNLYYNGANFVYKTSSQGAAYRLVNGVHYWETAPSGTAGATVTPSLRMVLDTSGNVGLGSGTTTANARLYVVGSDSTSSNWSIYGSNSSGTIQFGLRNDNYLFAPSVGNYGTTGTSVVINGNYLAYLSSSIRFKKDVVDYDKGLDAVSKLRPIYYRSSKPNQDGIYDERTYAGFIAEEVKELGLEEYIDYDQEGEVISLKYAQMTALLCKAIQELKAELDATKAEVQALKGVK